ncbi:MATE family efflux transporter [Spiroplasma eriocheiris]|uniref:MATE family efflux transporter n=1 Tax=Spiroplasma eriocheiris TaxID=315358 RepID=UPI00064B2C4A|nr:MATE family efflux transporter [Spiroplasma eriocheiris]AHF57516.1 hypothetical protein SPE_0387 [Spiroplasma eriocheiris CCTCC M 207170]
MDIAADKKHRNFYLTALLMMIPMTVQGLMDNFISLFNTFICGQFQNGTYSSDDIVAGIGSQTNVFEIVWYGLIGLVIAGNVYTSQYYGAKDFAKVRETMNTKLCYMVGFALISLIIVESATPNIISAIIGGENAAGGADNAIHIGVQYTRIGATNIKPIFFVLAVIAVGFAFIILAFFWTLLWAGIFFGGSFGWNKVAIPYNVGPAIPFALIIFVSSIGLGMMLASVFKSTTAFVAVSNVIYMPIAFLSGSFMPAELILNSNVLKYVTYINPFKYCLDPFLSAWKGNFSFTTTFAIYLAVSLGLLATYIGVASWKMRWQA